MEIEKGIESLKESVMKDCKNGENCFSENGCTKIRYASLPEENPKLIEMGFTTKCVAQTKCTHDYCGKYKWVLERAQHYADKTGKTKEEIIQIWEKDRSYWYMNYYQDCNQPLLNNTKKVIEYDTWINKLQKRFGKNPLKWAFKCPACGNIQTAQDFIDNNIPDPENKVYYNCIGRYINKQKGCDWTLGGLLKINKISVLKDAMIFPVFEMAPIKTKIKHETH